MPRHHALLFRLMAAALSVAALGAVAQGNSDPVAITDPGVPGMVTLDLPEQVELKLLIDYVADRHRINFIHEEDVGSAKVTIKAPAQIPADSLLALLGSALRMKGFILTPTEVPGMMRIEKAAAQMTTLSHGLTRSVDEGLTPEAGTALTRFFTLRHVAPQRVEEVIKPFLSTPRADVRALPDHDLIIVTDYVDTMPRLQRLIEMVDRPGREVVTRFVQVANGEAAGMAQKLTQLIKSKADARGAAAAGSLTVVADERTNQVIVVGAIEAVEELLGLIETLDASLALTTRMYSFSLASPERVDRLLKDLIGEQAAARTYRSALDEDARLLLATATPEIHEQIESLRARLDAPVEQTQSPIRFYKLQNAKATSVLETLRNVEGDGGLANAYVDVPVGTDGDATPGPGPMPVRRGSSPLASPAGDPAAPRAVNLGNARITADEATNTLIIVADPAIHPIYADLIQRLDVRRPQVLIEATIVAVDTTDDFSLGVEIRSSESANGGQVLNFTRFGLTTRDPGTGEFVSFSPGIGFTGALLDADIAEIVLRALETDSRARIVSRPSILVNDNAEGLINSVSEEPYESINASDTVATTSLGGFVEAGTKIKVIPQISEGDHLNLSYAIELSSFGEERTDTLPPSVQSDTLTSFATIPDNHTIVVGGLTGDNFTESERRVPLLGSIPVIKHLFSARDTRRSSQTLFVFIHARILRDDKFEDLKRFSADAFGRTELPSEHPKSEPVTLP